MGVRYGECLAAISHNGVVNTKNKMVTSLLEHAKAAPDN